MKDLNPYTVLLVLMLLTLALGCQTLEPAKPTITLTECSQACYPLGMSSASIYHGDCKCQKGDTL